jgi:hypothetical protein
MSLLKLQLCRILARDNTLIVVDVARETVQQCCFAGAGATRHENVTANPPNNLQDLGALRGDRSKPDELIKG